MKQNQKHINFYCNLDAKEWEKDTYRLVRSRKSRTRDLDIITVSNVIKLLVKFSEINEG